MKFDMSLGPVHLKNLMTIVLHMSFIQRKPPCFSHCFLKHNNSNKMTLAFVYMFLTDFFETRYVGINLCRRWRVASLIVLHSKLQRLENARIADLTNMPTDQQQQN